MENSSTHENTCGRDIYAVLRSWLCIRLHAGYEHSSHLASFFMTEAFLKQDGGVFTLQDNLSQNLMSKVLEDKLHRERAF